MSAHVFEWRPLEDFSADAAQPGWFAECVHPCREVWQRRDTVEEARSDAVRHNDRLHRGERVEVFTTDATPS